MTDFFYNKESYYINMSDENKKNVCCSTHDWEIPKKPEINLEYEISKREMKKAHPGMN